MILVGVGNSLVPLAVALVVALGGHAGALGLDLDRTLDQVADLGGQGVNASASASPAEVPVGQSVHVAVTFEEDGLLSVDLGDELRCSVITPSGDVHQACQGSGLALQVTVLEGKAGQHSLTLVPDEPGRYDVRFWIDSPLTSLGGGGEAWASFQANEPTDEPMDHASFDGPDGQQAAPGPTVSPDGPAWTDRALRLAGIVAAGIVVGLLIGSVIVWGLRSRHPGPA